MFPGQFIPGHHAWPGGPPIAAIVAAQQQGFAPAYPSSDKGRPVDPALVAAHRAATAAIAAATDDWERLLLAAVHDFGLHVENRKVIVTQRALMSVHHQALVDHGGDTDLWHRVFGGFRDGDYATPRSLTVEQTTALASWFASRAAGRVPTEDVGWPEQKTKRFGGVLTQSGRPPANCEAVAYRPGTPRKAWRVPWQVCAGNDGHSTADPLIDTAGDLFLPCRFGLAFEDHKGRTKKTHPIVLGMGFGSLTLLWMAGQLGIELPRSTAETLATQLASTDPY